MSKRTIEKDFEQWCKNSTASFGVDEEEDYNISWDDLTFYEELQDKVSELLTLAVQQERERIETILLSGKYEGNELGGIYLNDKDVGNIINPINQDHE